MEHDRAGGAGIVRARNTELNRGERNIMETVNTDVLSYVQHIGCGTFGKTLFYGRVPNSNKVSTALWWVVPNAASPSAHNVTGEDTIDYRYELSYRNTSLEAVDRELFRITKEVVGSHCYNLDNFHTMDVQLISSTPRFTVDSEQRVIGTVSFLVKVYNILETTNKSDNVPESGNS